MATKKQQRKAALRAIFIDTVGATALRDTSVRDFGTPNKAARGTHDKTRCSRHVSYGHIATINRRLHEDASTAST